MCFFCFNFPLSVVAETGNDVPGIERRSTNDVPVIGRGSTSRYYNRSLAALQNSFADHPVTQVTLNEPQSGEYLMIFTHGGKRRSASFNLIFTPLNNGRGYILSSDDTIGRDSTPLDKGYVANDGSNAWWKFAVGNGEKMVLVEGSFDFKNNVLLRGKWVSSSGNSGKVQKCFLSEKAVSGSHPTESSRRSSHCNSSVTDLQTSFVDHPFNGLPPQAGEYSMIFTHQGSDRAASFYLIFTPLVDDGSWGYKISSDNHTNGRSCLLIEEGYVNNDGSLAWWTFATGIRGKTVLLEGAFDFGNHELLGGKWVSNSGNFGAVTTFILVEATAAASADDGSVIATTAPVVAQPVVVVTDAVAVFDLI